MTDPNARKNIERDLTELDWDSNVGGRGDSSQHDEDPEFRTFDKRRTIFEELHSTEHTPRTTSVESSEPTTPTTSAGATKPTTPTD